MMGAEDQRMAESKIVGTPYDDLTCNVIGCAMVVHRKLGPGLREDSYQRDLEVHFSEAGIAFEAQKLYEVHDSLGGGQLIGYYFGLRSLQYKRIFPPKGISDHQVNRQWLFVPDWLKN